MARTAFIAFAGFFVGSVVTASIAYVAHGELPPVGQAAPPVPAAKPVPPMLAANPPSTASADDPDIEARPVPEHPIATAGFVPSGPILRFRTPSRATAPMPQSRPVARVAPPANDRTEPAPPPADAVAPAVIPGEREHVADDDLPAWRRYAALTPPTEGRPMVAIVLDDVGLNRFRAAKVTALPGPITIAILPYGRNAPAIAAQARRAGHEVMLHLPMEPEDHDHDPGPNALLTSLTPDELQRRIALNLSRFDGYVGINNHMGSRFTASEEAVTRVMEEVRARGLLFLDSVTSTRSVAFRVASQMGIPATARDVFIDADVDARSIRRQLRLIEHIARKRGAAIAIGHPHPETLEALRDWLPQLSARGFVLVPISAITAMRLAG